jgi:hypothetical protein
MNAPGLSLSNRKLKAFDRRGGAYLVLPWPTHMRCPAQGDLRLDDERPATDAQHLGAMQATADITRRYNLVHLATQVALLRPPVSIAGKTRPPTLWLLAHLVTPRWQQVTTPGGQAPLQWM